MNRQEKFDIMVNRLFDGKGRCMVGNSCVYLNDKGNKCVVGALIPDGHPAQYFEGQIPALKNIFDDDPVIVNDVIGEDYDLLYAMQKVHDGSSALWDDKMPSQKMIDKLEEIAEKYEVKLNIPV